MNVRDVVFVDGVRTPFGKAGGMYADTRADDLVIRCIRELLRRNPQLPPERVDEVAIAATTQIGDQGLTIGRTAALLAGLPKTVPGYAIDRMCAGAMTAVTTVAGGIAMGAYDVAIAGGVEHMGRHPMGEGVDPNPRILAEKLVDPSALVMGSTAENLHDRLPQHHQGARRRVRPGLAAEDRQGVRQRQAPGRPGAGRRSATPRAGWGLATVDEAPRDTSHGEARHAEDAVPPARQGHRGQRGRPQRRRHRRPARRRGRRPRAGPAGRACGWCRYGFVGVEPEVMGFGPIPSTEKALRLAGLTIDDIGLFELNEAFAVQVLAFLDHFGIADDDPRVNPWGGAIAIGHPLASSGVRLMTQLARQFAEHPEVRYGLTAMCIGIGMGGTVIWENPNWEGAK